MEFRDSTGKLIKTKSTSLFTTPQAEQIKCPHYGYTLKNGRYVCIVCGKEDTLLNKKRIK